MQTAFDECLALIDKMNADLDEASADVRSMNATLARINDDLTAMLWAPVKGFALALLACFVVLALTACTEQPGGIEVRTVEVPVPQPCLPADQIPDEPATVASQLNGVAAHDLAIVAASALELRAWGQEMAAALKACVG